MRNNPRQIDLEDLLHYQDAPDFIGPRLPKDHPAYLAFFTTRAQTPSTLRLIEPTNLSSNTGDT